MSKLTIKTNRIPRDIIDAYQLTDKERKEFDYLDWDKIDNGENSASFFRYKGRLYDLNEFIRIEDTSNQSGNPFTMKPEDGSPFLRWHGYMSDSYFSGIVIKYVNDDFEQVIVGTYYS